MKLLFLRKLILGLICGIAFSAIMLLVFSAVLSKQDDPTRNLTLFSKISLIAGAMICGKLSTLGVENKMFQGLASGIAFATVVLLPSTLLSEFDLSSLIYVLLTLISAFAGAMIGRRASASSASRNRRKTVIKRYAR